MKIKRYVRSYLFYITIALLLVSITASVVSFATISKKNKIAIQSVQSELKEALGIAQQQLQAQTEENEKLEKSVLYESLSLIESERTGRNEKNITAHYIHDLGAADGI